MRFSYIFIAASIASSGHARHLFSRQQIGRNGQIIASNPSEPFTWCGGPNKQFNVGAGAPCTSHDYTTYTQGSDGQGNVYTWGACNTYQNYQSGSDQVYHFLSLPPGATNCQIFMDQGCIGFPYPGVTIVPNQMPLDLSTVPNPADATGKISFASKIGSILCTNQVNDVGTSGQNQGGQQSGSTGGTSQNGSTGTTGSNGDNGQTGSCGPEGTGCTGGNPKPSTTSSKAPAKPTRHH